MGLCTSMQEFLGEIGKHRQGNIIIHQKFTSVAQKLEGIDKAVEGEVNKGSISVIQNLDAMMREAPKVDSALSKAPIKSDRSANFPHV